MYYLFDDPLTQVYRLFLEAKFPTLTNADKFLQRDAPFIDELKFHLTHLIKGMLLKLVSTGQVAQSYLTETLDSVHFGDPGIQIGHFVEIFPSLKAIDKEKVSYYGHRRSPKNFKACYRHQWSLKLFSRWALEFSKRH